MTHSRPASRLGDAIETFIRREDAERCIEEVRSDDRDIASYLLIEEREQGDRKAGETAAAALVVARIPAI